MKAKPTRKAKSDFVKIEVGHKEYLYVKRGEFYLVEYISVGRYGFGFNGDVDSSSLWSISKQEFERVKKELGI